jgi:hypothetical protein
VHGNRVAGPKVDWLSTRRVNKQDLWGAQRGWKREPTNKILLYLTIHASKGLHLLYMSGYANQKPITSV